MVAKLKHLAIASPNYPILGRFYETFFGMRESKNRRPHAAVVNASCRMLTPRAAGV